MTKDELKIQLVKKQIPEEFYSLNGGNLNEVFCLRAFNGKWETYYSERGMKSSKKEFITESEACVYFYNWLLESLANMGLIY